MLNTLESLPSAVSYVPFRDRQRVSRISRLVEDRDHVVTESDSIDAPMVLPGGRRVISSVLACNVAGAVGLPASVFLDAGLRVHEDWLAELKGSHVMRWIERVDELPSLWPEDSLEYRAAQTQASGEGEK
jgi:hypothetical protein